MRWAFVLTVSALAATLGGPAAAGVREDVLAGTARCGAIADDRLWLDCYYGAAQPMRSRFGLTPAPDFQIKLVPPETSARLPATPQARQQTASIAPAPRGNSGVMGALLGGATLINRMPVSAYSFDARGMLTVTLADGQVWQQLAGDDSFAKWRGPASQYVITIKQGSFGSANLAVQGESRTYKVRRLR